MVEPMVYHYSSIPTIRDFSRCNKRIRALMGPFGCLSGDSEFLSTNGWKRMDEYQYGDKVLAWDGSTGNTEFLEPTNYIDEPCESLLEFSCNSLSMVLSPEHRVPYYNYRGELAVASAAEIALHPSRREIPTIFHAPDGHGVSLSDDLIRFAVMMHADGHYPKQGRKATVSLRKGRKKTRLKALLDKLDIPYAERVYANRPTESVFSFVPPYIGKHFTGEWWLVNEHQASIVIDEMEHWDGLANHKELRFFSTTKADADFIQYCSHASGLRAIITQQVYSHEGWKPCWKVHIRRPGSIKNTAWVREHTNIKATPAPNGRKYCFTIPTGFFVARHNNTIFITGNSGKSSGCVIEVIRRAMAQEPGPDGVRHSRWAIVRNCYDDETEILTEKRGWQLFKNLLSDDKVATLNNGSIVYKQPEGVAAHPYNGEMIGFDGEGANFLVTPDHKMWVSKRRTRKKIWGDYEVCTAQEIYGSQTVRVSRAAHWNGENTTLSKDLFEFLGFWFAEGSYGIYGGRERVTVTQSKPVGIEYIRNVMKKAGIGYFENKRVDGGINFILHKSQELFSVITSLVRNAGKSTVKRVPITIKSAPKDHLSSFLRGYVMGDGSVYNGCARITTASSGMADDLQEIALKAGTVANISIEETKGRDLLINGVACKASTDTYRITILGVSKHNPILHVNPKHTNKLLGWHKKPYNGMVYCVEMELVPVYVRRRGKGFWCCRTYGQLKDTTMKTFFEWFPPYGPNKCGDYKVTDQTFTIDRFPGVNLEVMFRALDRPDQIGNLLSLELTGAWINEAREVPWPIIEAIDGRIGRYPRALDGGPTWTGIIMDTNPPDDDSKFYEFFEVERPDNAILFKQPSGLAENAENLPNIAEGRGYYENLMKGKPKGFIRVYVEGKYGTLHDGMPIYKDEWNDDIHIQEDLVVIRSSPLLLGWDFGLTPACVVGQIGPRGQLRILREFVSHSIGIRRFAEEDVLPIIRADYPNMTIESYGDPAGEARDNSENTAIGILNELGVPTVAAPTNDLEPRLESVKYFLLRMISGEPAFVMDKSCSCLRKGFNGGYRLKRVQVSGTDRYHSKPDKNQYSHIADALQYLCLGAQGSIRDQKRPERKVIQFNAHAWT